MHVVVNFILGACNVCMKTIHQNAVYSNSLDGAMTLFSHSVASVFYNKADITTQQLCDDVYSGHCLHLTVMHMSGLCPSNPGRYACSV